MGARPAAVLCLLLLTLSAGGQLSTTTAQVARATTTTTTTPISKCAEGGGTPCPDSVEPPPSTGPPAPPGGPGGPESPGGPGGSEGPGGPGGPEGPGRGLVGIPSAAPTPSPTRLANSSVVAECEEESAECLEDEECQGCYEIASGLSSSVEFEACREAYLGGGEGGSPSSSSSSPSSSSQSSLDSILSMVSPSTCDVAGAMYCCSNEISESDCLAGDKSSLYWGCVFESYGCELEEVACLAVLGESYRSDDDDVGGRAGNSLSGAAGRKAAAPWSTSVACVVAAALGLAVAATTSTVTSSMLM